MGAEEGVFESGDITYTGPNITSTVTRWGNGGVQTTTHIGEEKERSDLRFKVPSFGVTGSKCHEGTETSRGSSEQGDESVQDSEMTVTLRDNKNTAGSHVTAGSGGAGIISTDENGGSGRLSLPGKGMKILTATTEKTQMGSSDSTLDERTKVKISGITISPLQTKGSGSTDIPHIRIGGSTDTGANLKDGRIEKSTITLDNVTSGLSSKKSELDIKGAGVQIKGPRANTEGSVLSVRHSESESDIGSAEINSNIQIKLPTTDSKYKMDVNVPSISGLNKVEGKGDLTGERKTAGLKFDIKGSNTDTERKEGTNAHVQIPEADIKAIKPSIDSKDVKIKGPSVDIKRTQVNVTVPAAEFGVPKAERLDVDLKLSKSKTDTKIPKVENKAGIKGEIKTHEIDVKGLEINLPRTGIDVKAPDFDITGPQVDTEDLDVNLKGSKIEVPSLSGTKLKDLDMSVKGPKMKGNVDVPNLERDIKTPKMKIEGKEIDSEGQTSGLIMSNIKMPSLCIKGPKPEGQDVNINLSKTEINGDLQAPKVDIEGRYVNIEGPDVKLKGPKFNLPSLSGPSLPDFDINLKGPKVKGDVSAPKVEGDIKGPKMDIQGPEIDIQGPKSSLNMPSIKMPSFGFKGPKVEGPDADIHLPKADINVKTPKVDITVPEVECSYAKPKGPKMKLPSLSGPKLEGPKVKGEVDASVPMFESDIKGPNANISNDDEKTAVTFPKFKGPKFAMKTPVLEESKSNIKMPSTAPKSLKTEVSFPDTDASVDAPDIDINVKGKKGKFKLPKVKGKAKKPDVDIETPATEINADITNSYAKGTKTKKSRFGKLHFPDVELDIKSPKLKGDGSLSAIDGSGSHSANVNLEGSNMKVKSSNIKMQSGTDSEINASASGGSASGGLQYPEGKVTFTKITMPKFGIVLPQVETKESGGNIESEPAASVDIKTESPSISCQVSSQNIEVPSPELRQEGKVKVKMPKIFGKSKAKGSSVGDLHGSEAELSSSGKAGKTSKELSVHSGEMMGGKIELEGDPGLGLSTKGKSASLDLFKKSRHRSSSFSDEGGVSSPSAQLEAEGGDISLDLGSKVKGKKGKLKFGTFGGFGSKSKGSYEVTLGDDSEARMEGSAGVSLPAKKSRLSSSSSSDSGSRGGFRFPKVELSVSPTK
uniref:AHNAK nucleoprotein n=1 Tax=Pundamilia nyererei TaxID=303518 RepID=A0A3B4GI54_9CICH